MTIFKNSTVRFRGIYVLLTR